MCVYRWFQKKSNRTANPILLEDRSCQRCSGGLGNGSQGVEMDLFTPLGRGLENMALHEYE